MPTTSILTTDQCERIHAALDHRLIAASFGAGVDSTAVLVVLHEAGVRPHVITFADTGGEKPTTYEHVRKMDRVLASWGWPTVDVCRHKTKPTTPYDDLYGNCWANETLPSLAFGMKSCSIKWKQNPQDLFLRGAKSGANQGAPHPVWTQARERNERIVKLIGYDCGKADLRRSKNLKACDAHFDFVYPLQLIGWTRADCTKAIVQALGLDLLPVKSACTYCPATKRWELFWLAAEHPEMLQRALDLERRALTGRHSRFDAVEFGASWDDLVQNADRFPSTTTTVGLGRSFAWSQWARLNDVTDAQGIVRTDRKGELLAMAERLRGDDNALDVRSVPCAA